MPAEPAVSICTFCCTLIACLLQHASDSRSVQEEVPVTKGGQTDVRLTADSQSREAEGC